MRPHTNQHQPPHIKGDNRRQWETTGGKTTSEPKKPTTLTNTKAARSKVALRTPTVNCLGKKTHSDLNMPQNKFSSLMIELQSKHTTKQVELSPLKMAQPCLLKAACPSCAQIRMWEIVFFFSRKSSAAVSGFKIWSSPIATQPSVDRYTNIQDTANGLNFPASTFDEVPKRLLVLQT